MSHFEFLAFSLVVLKTSFLFLGFLFSVCAGGQVQKAAQDAVHEKDGSHTNRELAHETF